MASWSERKLGEGEEEERVVLWWLWWLISEEAGTEERVVEDGEQELPLELALELPLELRIEEREGEGVRSFGCLTSLRMNEDNLPLCEWFVVSFAGCSGIGSIARKGVVIGGGL